MTVAMPVEMAAAMRAIRRLRVTKVGLLEAALVDLVAAELDLDRIPYRREERLAPRCRVDIAIPAASSGLLVGIEAKRGRPHGPSATAQVERYAATGKLAGIVFLAERTMDLPAEIHGIPVATISLQSAWGLAL